MEQLEARFQQAVAIAKKYELSTRALENNLAELRNFQVTVPFIGSFNTGKSSLLNALLGFPILPVDIVAKTTVPTEVVYGPNEVMVFRGAQYQRANIPDVRNGVLDLHDVSMLQIQYQNEFLRRIHSVKIVDMPGLDSNINAYGRSTRQYLSQSLAYVLVFSADEPVIKESIAEFLAELQLWEMPVFVILTKCDKVIPEQLSQAQAFLKQSLTHRLGVPQLNVGLTHSKANPDVRPVADLLLQLQEQADHLCRREFSGRLRESCAPIRTYLESWLAGKKLTVSELDGRIAQLQSEGQRLQTALEESEKHFSGLVQGCSQKSAEKLALVLADAAEPVETLLLSGQDAEKYLTGILARMIRAGILGEYLPLRQAYQKSVRMLLQASGADGCAPEPQAQSGTAAVEAALTELSGSASIFQDFFSRLGTSTSWKKKQSAIHTLCSEFLLPQLSALVRRCLQSGIDSDVQQTKSALSNLVLQDFELRKQTLEDIRRQKCSDDSLRLHSVQELTADLDTLLSTANPT